MEGNQAKVKVERKQDQDQVAHLTHPHVGVGRVANRVAATLFFSFDVAVSFRLLNVLFCEIQNIQN